MGVTPSPRYSIRLYRFMILMHLHHFVSNTTLNIKNKRRETYTQDLNVLGICQIILLQLFIS